MGKRKRGLCVFAQRARKKNWQVNEIMNIYFFGLKNQQDNVDLESKPSDLHLMTL